MFQGSPLACPGARTGPALDPVTALLAMSHFMLLEEMTPVADVFTSLLVDLNASPETRDVPGMVPFREAVHHMMAGRIAARGALRRMLCGDPSAASSLAVAGHLMIQAGHLIGPQLERLIMESPPEARPQFEHLRGGLTAMEPVIRQFTGAVEHLVPPAAWGAAKQAAADITGYGAA